MNPLELAARAEADRDRREDMRLSAHAKERMAEMGVTRAQVLDIIDNPSVDRPSFSYRHDGSRRECRTCVSDRWPRWSVAWGCDGRDDLRVVISVLFRSHGTYERQGATFRLAGEG